MRDVQSENPIFERLVSYEEKGLSSCDDDPRLVDCEYLDALPAHPEHSVEAFVLPNLLIPIPHSLVRPLDQRLYRSRTCPE